MNKKQTERLINKVINQALDPHNTCDHYIESKKKPKTKKAKAKK